MNNKKENELEERITRLEQRIASLEKQINSRSADDTLTIVADKEETVSPDHPAREKAPQDSSFVDTFQIGENWLNALGIGLLLLGVAFLFKYSIDQGWLIPPIRSLIGLGIGLALFIPGLQLSEKSVPMKQICLGGGIAAFYITGFATFQLYSFVASPIVWIFMIIVTLLALSLSLQQNQSVLSVVGVLGGLGTPFMLYSGAGSLSSLILYMSLILSGAATIYLYRGWRSLLWTMTVGGWLIMLVGFLNNIADIAQPVRADQWSLQAGVLVCLAAFWMVPVLREVLSHRYPEKWPDPSFLTGGSSVNNDVVYVQNPSAQLMGLVIPILCFLYSMALWDITWQTWGVIAMSLSLFMAYLYLPMRKEGLQKLASIHGFAALIFLTISLLLLLEGDLLFALLALEALGLRIIAFQTRDNYISVSSHILTGFVFLWLIENFTSYSSSQLVVLNLDALTQLFIIGIAGIGLPVWMRQGNTRLIYRIAAHLALLGWFLSELSSLENGQAYVSVSWGVYAIILLIIGFMKEVHWLRLVGMATIFLVVGKLFFIDLSQLQAIWRILLFIGFGAVFLLIGYVVQTKFSDVTISHE